MDGIVKRVALAVLLLVLLGASACGQQENAQPSSPADTACSAVHREAPNKDALWARLLPEVKGHEPDRVRVKRADGTVVETLSIPLQHPGEEEVREHLDGIAYPGPDSTEAVRCYAASVLRSGIEARRVFGSGDPEVDLLAPVARDHPAILVEAAVHADLQGAESYVTWALTRSMGEGNKRLLIDALDDAPWLVSVVAERGWAEDAAPALLRGLKTRSTYLLPDWVTAAAQVAGPDQYADLRFQMAEGQDPVAYWLAIRDLPGMGPLDGFVDATWKRMTPEEYHCRWYEFSVVAAHYGHVDALGPFAETLVKRRRWWDLFVGLTGFGRGREDAARYADAVEWVTRNEGRLKFDPSERRFRLKPSGDR